MEDSEPSGVTQRTGRRVLIVDDNEDIADTLVMVLDMLGHEARCARDGESALRDAESFHPDVVLIDIGLPRIDGYEVARRMRRIRGLERVRLLAMTGYGRDEDRKQAREAGFDQHLLKPVDIEALERAIGQARPVARDATNGHA